MCERLADIRTAFCGFAAGFEPELICAADAERVVADAAAIEASAAAVKALAAARAAEGGGFRGPGKQSAAEGLAAAIGVGTSAARDLLAIGRRLVDQPKVAAAAKSGALSPARVALVANAGAADPGAGDRLLELASRSSLGELRDECARVKAAVGDAEERRRLIRSRRRLRAWTDVEGVWHLSAVGNPEDGAQVMAALGPRIEEQFRAARAAGVRESPDAYAFDALVGLARDAAAEDDDASDRPGGDRPTAGAGGRGSAGDAERRTDDASVRPGAVEPSGSGDAHPAEVRRQPPEDGGGRTSPRRRRRRRGAPVKLLIRIDYDVWLRGVARDGETCELVGYGPVAVSAVRDLVESGDPFVAAILTKGRAVVGVAHLGRRPTAHQKSALQWLYPSCAARGCVAQARLEADHRLDWARTNYTVFDLLDLLCHRHHALKTRENWALVDGTGKRDFVPPSDPRHPRHAAVPA